MNLELINIRSKTIKVDPDTKLSIFKDITPLLRFRLLLLGASCCSLAAHNLEKCLYYSCIAAVFVVQDHRTLKSATQIITLSAELIIS